MKLLARLWRMLWSWRKPALAASRDNPAFPMQATLRALHIVRNDPGHFTERALRSSACWQVFCEQMFALRKLTIEAAYHGDHPVGEFSRFQQELLRAQVQETYARAQLQCSLDWLVSGQDLSSSYDQHCVDLWGPELGGKVRKWWLARFEFMLKRLVANHMESLNTATAYAQAMQDTNQLSG